MLWRHSESLLLLLLAILTNRSSLLQQSKCTFSNTMDTIIDIKIALTKGLKSLEPFHTGSLEECHNKCCTDPPFIGKNNLCNFMTFDPRNNSSFQNCYLFYCPDKDACPLMSSEGFVSHFIQRDLASMKELDEPMKEILSDREEQLSDHGISADLLNNPISNLASTPINTHRLTIVSTVQKATVQPVTFSTHPTVSTFSVATKKLTITRSPRVSMVATLLRNTHSWTIDKSKTSTILPTTQSITASAFLANLPLTSTRLTRTNRLTPLLNKIQPMLTTTVPQIRPNSTTQTTTLPVTTTQTTTLPTTHLITITQTRTTLPTTLPVTTIRTTTLSAITLRTTTLPVTTPQIRTTLPTTLPVTTLQTTRSTLLTMTILPKSRLTTRNVSVAKQIPKKSVQSPLSKAPVVKTPFFGIITVASHNRNDSILDQKQHLERQDKSAGQMDNSKVKIQSGLIAALLFGLLFLIIVMFLLSKRISESYSRRQYTRINYLINGMYIAA
ncbi:hepatitis A virus cellular receptor 1-like [Stegostoma tigrinum]|uniref:hepatitis A virus cellular receptor 1-like n=1 Tax=Stegostoma tigrinum TaxID=3053191 RepID=UPI00202AEB7B|nr:hepatitis A virus cellular receptor 1-like [Stegostoma tigrinum]XP_048405372.1 hepatitis A virus cellular receptor 1-like [Stegostoma tigrinum]XP_048405373.1 hepatitis A virus cellular receptor 1-like [Stegostoma tigrinum]XP_048405374.1 hepatitis A virus cellular receptor 1-like [Stegostoma tigrinum]